METELEMQAITGGDVKSVRTEGSKLLHLYNYTTMNVGFREKNNDTVLGRLREVGWRNGLK